MKKRFVVQRDGKSFVLYAGLLDEAHGQGLKAIRTELVQTPTEENGLVAVVHATVETERGVFQGLGDASPSNVTRLMVPHLLRMAETRAKARALRDAVNVGVAALEELGPDEPDESLTGGAAGRLQRSYRSGNGASPNVPGRSCQVCGAAVHPAAAQRAPDGSYRCPRHRVPTAGPATSA